MNILKGFTEVIKTGSISRGLITAVGFNKTFRHTCNPFTDLPNDAELENTLCEVRYIHHTLRHYMLPTTLPGDDLDLCSRMLRSLETRTDLTPLVLEETSIHSTMRGIARFRKPPPHEPRDLQSRAIALESHWNSHRGNSGHLAPGYATCPSPPLVQEDYELALTLEQAAEAEADYRIWRTNRDRKVSYLKRHPPEPVLGKPVSRGQIASDAVWESLPWSAEDLYKAPEERRTKLEPIFKSMGSQPVPLDWVNPDAPRAVTTRDEKRRWKEKRRMRSERKDKQVKYAKELTVDDKGRV
ncbi:hypothetical protein ACHAPT_010393 [Fusarium lateritium]